MQIDEKQTFIQRTSTKQGSQTSNNSQDLPINQQSTSRQNLGFSDLKKESSNEINGLNRETQEINADQNKIDKPLSETKQQENMLKERKLKPFSFIIKKVGRDNDSPVSNMNYEDLSAGNQSNNYPELKKDGTMDTPNSEQISRNISGQIVEQKKHNTFFSRFKISFNSQYQLSNLKEAYFGSKTLGNQKSLDSLNSNKQTQSAPNTPKKQMTQSKGLGGAFSFLKAVTLLRSRKVVPVKKMTKEDIRKLFRKSYITICEDIRNFGTSPNLFDVAVRSRMAVKKILFPMSFADTSSKKNDQNNLEFPLISPSSKIITCWNPVLLSLIFYSATILPYRIAFQDEQNIGWEIFDFLVEGLFWVDLLINMFSSYYDDDNQLIKKRSVVVISYLKSWFIIDFLCCIPIEMIAGAIINDSTSSASTTATSTTRILSSQLNIIKLAKIPRLYRLLKITKIIKMVRYFGSDSKILHFLQVNSGILRLINLFFLVFVVVHFIGCLWFYQAKIFDFSEETWVFRNHLTDASNVTLYLYSIYYVFTTITTVGYGDINAFTNTEIIISLVLMVIGVGFYSSTIGILSSVIQYMDQKHVLLSRKVEIMNEYCNEMKIPNNIKKQLKEALQYTLDKNCFIWANQNKIFDQLPMNLKYEICMNIYRGVMKSFSFFNLADDQSFVVRIIPELRPLKLNPGDVIWNQRDVSDSIYLLSSGRVNYMKQVVEDIKTKERKSITFKTMINGSYFGEIDIIFDRKRRYRCQAETVCELYYMTRQEYETIIRKEFPHIHQKLKKIAFERDKKNEEALKALKKLIRQAKEATADLNVKVHTTDQSPLKIPNLRMLKVERNSLSNIAEHQKSENEHSFNNSPYHNDTVVEKITAKQKFQRAVKKIINKIFISNPEFVSKRQSQTLKLNSNISQQSKQQSDLLNPSQASKQDDMTEQVEKTQSKQTSVGSQEIRTLQSFQNLTDSSHTSSKNSEKDFDYEDEQNSQNSIQSDNDSSESENSGEERSNSSEDEEEFDDDESNENDDESNQSDEESNENSSENDESDENSESEENDSEGYSSQILVNSSDEDRNEEKNKDWDLQKKKNSNPQIPPNQKTDDNKSPQNQIENNDEEKSEGSNDKKSNKNSQKSSKLNSIKKQRGKSQKNKTILNTIANYNKTQNEDVKQESRKNEENENSEYIFLKEELRKNNKKMEILEDKFKNLEHGLQNSINLVKSIQNKK